MSGPLQAYRGPAPAPARSIQIGEQQVNVDTVVEDAGLLPSVGPPNREEPPPLPRAVRAGAGPSDPESTQALTEMRAQLAEMQSAIGRMRSDHEAQLAEAQLNHELTLLQMAATQPQNVLPPNVDPSTPVNAGELAGILTEYGNQFQAGIIRQSWDVTPDEEQAVLNSNPSIASLKEPQRTFMIQKAAQIRRKSAGRAGTAPSAPSAAPAGPSTVRPIVPGSVAPHTEAAIGGAGTVSDAAPETDYARAIRAYKDADRITNKTERLAAKRKAMEGAQRALGIDPAQAVAGGWASRI